MKRPASFPVPESPAEPRRKRALSEEERALWESVARQIKPLRKKPRATKSAASASASEPPAAAKPAATPRPVHAVQAPKPSKPAAPPLAPLGRRERTRLSRGRSEIDARLDLVLRRQVPHWLSLPECRSLVVGFEEAHVGHGGEGALYVRIRRARA